MFNSLLSFLTSRFAWIKWFFVESWRQVVGLVTNAWAIALLVVAWLAWVLSFLRDLMGMIADYIDRLAWPEAINLQTLSGPARQLLEVANTFFPLNEFFSMLVGFATLWIGLMALSAVRKLLP